jgi:hypothetical protein
MLLYMDSSYNHIFSEIKENIELQNTIKIVIMNIEMKKKYIVIRPITITM